MSGGAISAGNEGHEVLVSTATCGKVDLQAPTYVVGGCNENDAEDGLGNSDGDKEHSDCPIEPR